MKYEPLKPEEFRKAHVEEHARIQKLKLTVAIILGVFAWIEFGCPVPW